MPFVLRSDGPPSPRLPPVKKEPKLPKEFERLANTMSYMVQPATAHETNFRHAGWLPKRNLVRAALVASGRGDFAINRFDQCGSQCTVEWSETLQKHRLTANYCKCRHCEPCMRAKANKLARNLKLRLQEQPNGRYRFITLTLKHNTAPLREQIKRLYASFRKLRHSKLWQETQRGGASTLEVKWQADTCRWHPHLHIITEGEFIAQWHLSDAWLAATGDSSIVDVRSLKSGHDAAYYVAKYVTKGTSANVWRDPQAAAEWIAATAGVRVCATFGTWRGFKLTANVVNATDWQPVAHLDALMQRAAAGELHAANLLIILRRPTATDSS